MPAIRLRPMHRFRALGPALESAMFPNYNGRSLKSPQSSFRIQFRLKLRTQASLLRGPNVDSNLKTQSLAVWRGGRPLLWAKDVLAPHTGRISNFCGREPANSRSFFNGFGRLDRSG